nr:retinol dehydrogenase 12-like [Onthophagus taurus]
MGLSIGRCLSPKRLTGKTAVITGGNSGIGKETAKDFYLRGCNVIIACRVPLRAQEAIDDIKRQCLRRRKVGTLDHVQMDLKSLSSIRRCAMLLQQKPTIHLLVNNAGIMACPFSKTSDGFEIQWGVNYLGHFFFTLLLLPKLIESRPVRIINLGSIAHLYGNLDFTDLNWERRKYSSTKAYAQSKLCMILFTRELAKRLYYKNIHGINVYAVHPGVVKTNLYRFIEDNISVLLSRFTSRGIFMKTPEEGAQTTIYCAVEEDLQNETGFYYADCKRHWAAGKATHRGDAERLWIESLKYCKLENYDPFKIT